MEELASPMIDFVSARLMLDPEAETPRADLPQSVGDARERGGAPARRP